MWGRPTCTMALHKSLLSRCALQKYVHPVHFGSGFPSIRLFCEIKIWWRWLHSAFSKNGTSSADRTKAEPSQIRKSRIQPPSCDSSVRPMSTSVYLCLWSMFTISVSGNRSRSRAQFSSSWHRNPKVAHWSYMSLYLRDGPKEQFWLD